MGLWYQVTRAHSEEMPTRALQTTSGDRQDSKDEGFQGRASQVMLKLKMGHSFRPT